MKKRMRNEVREDGEEERRGERRGEERERKDKRARCIGATFVIGGVPIPPGIINSSFAVIRHSRGNAAKDKNQQT